MPNPDEQRLLDVDLGAGGPWRVAAWSACSAAHRRMASWRGGGLSLALLAECDPAAVPLVLSVGECVARGVPTAARVSVASRSPLSGSLAEGLVGSDFGRRMATVADALRLRGRAARADSVLVIEADGTAHLAAAPRTRGRSSAATHAELEAQLGPCATLSVGPLGESGSRIASLAACSSSAAGGGPPHFVGRGGLGAVLARAGLKAIAVRAPAVASVRDSELTRALTSSPRLEARARGGTLELAHSLAARGDLGDSGDNSGDNRGDNRSDNRGDNRGDNRDDNRDDDGNGNSDGNRVDNNVGNIRGNSGENDGGRSGERRGEDGGGGSGGRRGANGGAAREFARAAESARDHQHGCVGCPTPCGWVFKRSEGPGQAARFGASHALGLQLGFSDFDAALGLLARCDELGLDAKEVGAGLALLAELDPSARGRPEFFARVLDEAARGTGPAAALVDGVHALGLALGRATTTVRRSSVRPDKNLASLLGQCVSARGTDPMRAFPFLAAESSSLSALRELCAPLELPEGSEDPFSEIGKGRLVAWHEDLVLALDLTGFCAFSASALLTDRLASLDALALWIAPRALAAEAGFAHAPGRALLAAGAEIARAQRELNARWGWKPADDVPDWARARLGGPSMEPEYRAVRERRAAFERRSPPGAPARTPGLPAARRERGSVRLCSFGSLGKALGPACAVELDLPAAALDVLHAAALKFPDAARLLLEDGAPVPALYRSGARVDPHELVAAGQTLDLLLVVGGG